MDGLSALDLKAFVPSEDLAVSKRFYLDLGFALNWENDAAAQFELGSCRFILQKFFIEQHAHNFMMQLLVEDADLWWERIAAAELTRKYPGVTAKPPALQPWGMRVLYLVDPTGVLWHIADLAPEARPAVRPAVRKLDELRRVRRELRVEDCDLSQSSFVNVKLERARFTDVNLGSVLFDDVNLAGAQFTNINMAGMTVDGILLSDLLDAYRRINGGPGV